MTILLNYIFHIVPLLVVVLPGNAVCSQPVSVSTLEGHYLSCARVCGSTLTLHVCVSLISISLLPAPSLLAISCCAISPHPAAVNEFGLA